MVKLVIGGSNQGKTAVAKQLFSLQEDEILHGSEAAGLAWTEKRALAELHELVRYCLQRKEPLAPILARLKQQTTDFVFICDEVGCGVVPIDPEERAWREAVGRLCCQLAKEADQVIRVCCGIPTVLKGEPLL